MRHVVLLWILGVSLGLSVVPAGAVPQGTIAPGVAPSRAPRIVLTGLELRYGAPAKPRASPPAPAPAARPSAEAVSPPQRPIDAAVDAGVRHQHEVGGKSPDDAGPAASGAPVSTEARHVLEEIARNAGIDAGDMASAVDSPHDQALFLVERMFDPHDGVAAVRARYGTAGALAVESYRRMRDSYKTLDLNAEQRRNLVVVVETALIVGGAVRQVGNPDYQMVDVDPGARVDPARFERAVAASGAVARCVRPTGRAGDRLYLLEIPRRGSGRGGAVCANDRPDVGSASIVVQPPSPEALARFSQSITTVPQTSPAIGAAVGSSVTTVPPTNPAVGAGLAHAIETVPSSTVGVPPAPLPSAGASPLISPGSVVTRVLTR